MRVAHQAASQVVRYVGLVDWKPDTCRALAEELMAQSGDRWVHVQAVSGQIEHWVFDGRAPETVLCAGWLHDIGYTRSVGASGMHAIDGAAYLEPHGLPQGVVSLVAFHTGARFEAEERGLVDRLLWFDLPDQDMLDLLTLADLTTSPQGEPVTVADRIDEILERYEPQHPVHRGVLRGRAYLEECCRRAAAGVGQPM